jgi:hypothetical protein
MYRVSYFFIDMKIENITMTSVDIFLAKLCGEEASRMFEGSVPVPRQAPLHSTQVSTTVKGIFQLWRPAALFC